MVLALREIKEIDNFALELAKEEEEEEAADTVLAPDVVQLLVLKRLLAKESVKEESQREHIFHSQCTIQGKVCSLIIDGASCCLHSVGE